MSGLHYKDEQTQIHSGLAAPLVGFAILILAVLGLSAYWWNIARIPSCSSGHLKLTLGQPQGAAGTSYMDAILTNSGAGSCKIAGYPTVFLADGSGTIQGLGAATSFEKTPTSFTLASNKSAHALLGFPDETSFQPGICSAASKLLKVYPPGQTTALQTSFTQYSCPGFLVTALQPGT